jgi:hypothetical protein
MFKFESAPPPPKVFDPSVPSPPGNLIFQCGPTWDWNLRCGPFRRIESYGVPPPPTELDPPTVCLPPVGSTLLGPEGSEIGSGDSLRWGFLDHWDFFSWILREFKNADTDMDMDTGRGQGQGHGHGQGHEHGYKDGRSLSLIPKDQTLCCGPPGGSDFPLYPPPPPGIGLLLLALPEGIGLSAVAPPGDRTSLCGPSWGIILSAAALLHDRLPHRGIVQIFLGSILLSIKGQSVKNVYLVEQYHPGPVIFRL